jgi:hypothetical protein
VTALVQSLALAWASGVSVYATVALLGLAQRVGLVGSLPSPLDVVGAWWVIALASALYAVEFLATLIPGVASAWETFHSAIRPIAGAVIAAATVTHADHRLTLVAALLGGTLALGTHATKMGLRYAIDASPEPVTNGVANVAELGMIAAVGVGAWHHPYVALGAAIALLLLGVLLLRILWRTLRRVVRGARGLTQNVR